MPPWTDPRWLADARTWIDEHLARLGVRAVGEIEQPHVRPWSTVIRVPTDEGDLWFKANAEHLRHEARSSTCLAERRPDCVPALLARDLERGWMLMADAGSRLRGIVEEERELGRWLDVLPLYAGLQLDLAADADELVALGAPDLRLAGLAPRFELLLDELEGRLPDDMGRLRARVSQVEELSRELASYGLPETIQHDDLHDGQVYVRDGGYLFLDWGDACVSHPFFTLSVTLEGGIAWGLDDVQGSVDLQPYRDAYLGPFARCGSPRNLAAACEVALRLGWVCRAVNGHLPGDVDATRARLRMFLDGRP